MSDTKPTLHHLNNSQSQRILWLLEELEIPYNLKLHERQKSGGEKNRAPPELKETHQLGKSPQLDTGDGRIIVESSAIAKYLIEKYDTADRFKGNGKPGNDSIRDEELSSFAGASIGPMMILEMMMEIITKSMPFFIRPLHAGLHGMVRKMFISPEINKSFQYLDEQLGEQDYFMGDSPSRCDFLLEYPTNFCVQRGYFDIKQYANLNKWYNRIHERKAWKSALEKGNGYDMSVF